jgi:hypothetical protein
MLSNLNLKTAVDLEIPEGNFSIATQMKRINKQHVEPVSKCYPTNLSVFFSIQ